MKNPANSNRNSKKNQRGKIKRIAFFVFLAIFLFSGFHVLRDLLDSRKAADSYAAVQMAVRDAELKKTSEQASGTKDGNKEPVSPNDPVTQPPEKTEEEKVPVISMDFTPLKKINNEVVGWIRAEGTNIDYPIVRTDNNDYYLNHLYDRTVNDHGAIFMDFRCMGDLSDPNTVIYGHHMGNGTMFATLREYRYQDFYDANPTMEIFTPEGDYVLELICGTIEDGNNEFVSFDFRSDEELLQYVDRFRAKSTFTSDVELQPGDRIVSLCTCSYEWINARYMVIGRLVPVTA